MPSKKSKPIDYRPEDIMDAVYTIRGGGQAGDVYIDPVKNKSYYAAGDSIYTPATSVQGQSDVGTGYPGMYPQYGPNRSRTGTVNLGLPAVGNGTDVSGFGQYLNTVQQVTGAGSGYMSQADRLMNDYTGGIGAFNYDKERPMENWNRAQEIQGEIDNRDPFSYDYQTDPLWGIYKQAYTREGVRAQEDALGQYAAMTGGMPSSAAIAAAQQQRNYYNAAMTDKIPELQKLAYDMYLSDLDERRKDVEAYRQLAYDENSRYDTDLAQAYKEYADAQTQRYNAANQYYNMGADQRDYAYKQTRDAVSDAQWQAEFDRLLGRDAVADSQWQAEQDFKAQQRQDQLAQLALENSRYDTEYKDKMTQQGFENDITLQKLASTLAQQQFDNNLTMDKWRNTLAQQALENQRYDSETAYNRSLNAQKLAAAQQQQAIENALAQMKYQDAAEKERYEAAYKLATEAAKYGDYSGLEQLGVRVNLENVQRAALAGKGDTDSLAALAELGPLNTTQTQTASGHPVTSTTTRGTGTAQITNRNGDGWIEIGNSRYSLAEVLKMQEDKKVVQYVDPTTGKITYAKTNKVGSR